MKKKSHTHTRTKNDLQNTTQKYKIDHHEPMVTVCCYAKNKKGEIITFLEIFC
jgi:hypothetical protein